MAYCLPEHTSLAVDSQRQGVSQYDVLHEQMKP